MCVLNCVVETTFEKKKGSIVIKQKHKGFFVTKSLEPEENSLTWRVLKHSNFL
jgi:hypothetical protein